MKKTKKRDRLIGVTAIVLSTGVFVGLLSVFLTQKIQQNQLNQEIQAARNELQEAFDLAAKLKDDEYYQIYTPDGNYLITSDGKIVIDFGK